MRAHNKITIIKIIIVLFMITVGTGIAGGLPTESGVVDIQTKDVGSEYSADMNTSLKLFLDDKQVFSGNPPSNDYSFNHIIKYIKKWFIVDGTGIEANGDTNQTEPILKIDSAKIDEGEDETVQIILTSAPEGISGFQINVSIEDSSIGKITDASIESPFNTLEGAYDTTIDSHNSTVTLTGADFSNEINPGTTNITLAKVTIEGIENGTTDLTPAVPDNLQGVQNESGGPINPATSSGTLTVENNSQDDPKAPIKTSKQETAGGVVVTIERLTTEDKTLLVDTDNVDSGTITVEEVSTTFEQVSYEETKITITASETRPSQAPESPASDVLSYVTVNLEGDLTTAVSEGSFTVDVSNSPVTAEAVTAYRHDGTNWEEVETKVVDKETIRVISPEGYSVFVLGTNRQTQTTTPTATAEGGSTATAESGLTTKTAKETATTLSGARQTQTPAGTSVGTSESPVKTATSTRTPGVLGHGFGFFVAVLSIVFFVRQAISSR